MKALIHGYRQFREVVNVSRSPGIGELEEAFRVNVGGVQAALPIYLLQEMCAAHAFNNNYAFDLPPAANSCVLYHSMTRQLITLMEYFTLNGSVTLARGGDRIATAFSEWRCESGCWPAGWYHDFLTFEAFYSNRVNELNHRINGLESSLPEQTLRR